MTEVLEPEGEWLKQFVDSIYIFKRSEGKLEFTAYPSANTPVALFRDATMTARDGIIHIDNSNIPNYLAAVCNQFFSSARLQYVQLVDEIAINFKPLGFSSFTRSKPGSSKVFFFNEWNKFLPGLFRAVFDSGSEEQQLYHIEQFLLEQYIPLPGESMLLRAVELLNNVTTNYKMQEIADVLCVHYKQLYRQFTENVGCNPAHYRKLVKFRDSVVSKLKKGDKARLVDICYAHDYTDQPYFIKQFRELTGENPTRFFKEATSFGNEKVIFKIG